MQTTKLKPWMIGTAALLLLGGVGLAAGGARIGWWVATTQTSVPATATASHPIHWDDTATIPNMRYSDGTNNNYIPACVPTTTGDMCSWNATSGNWQKATWNFNGNNADLTGAGTMLLAPSTATAVQIGTAGTSIPVTYTGGSGGSFVVGTPAALTVGTISASPPLYVRGAYNAGAGNVADSLSVTHTVDSTTPTSHTVFSEGAGGEVLRTTWDGTNRYLNLAGILKGPASATTVLQSQQANATGAAFSLKALNAYSASTNPIFEVTNNASTSEQPVFRIYAGGAGTTIINAYSQSTGAILSGLVFQNNWIAPNTGGFAPQSDNQSFVGSSTIRFTQVGSYWYDAKVGLQLTAAATITPTSCIHHVTGATTITTIATTNVPTSTNVALVLVADTAFTTATGGNIAVGTSVPINTTLTLTWDSTAAKWYPSK